MYVAWLSSVATVCLQAQQASSLRVMRSLVEQTMKFANENPQQDGGLQVHVSSFQFPDRLQIEGPEGEALVIHEARALFDKISLPNQVPPAALGFELLGVEGLETAESYEQPVSHSHTLPDRYIADLWGYLIAGAYERNEYLITRRYGSTKVMKTWPPELQLFHHVRNAAFHGGRFDIWKSKNEIDHSRPPSWHRYTIASEDAVAGRYAISDFLPTVHVLPFVREISIALDNAR